jgi:Flp pilus assembly protein TadD
MVYQEQGRFDLALEQWRRVVDEIPKYRPGWRGVGDCLRELKRLHELREIAAHLSATRDLRATGLVMAALNEHATGNSTRRGEILSQARSEFPIDREVLREWCRFTFENRDRDEAAVALRELVRLDPNDPSAFHNYGVILLQLGRIQEAGLCLTQSLHLRPDSAPTRALLNEVNRLRPPASEVDST